MNEINQKMSKTYRKIKYLSEGPYGSRDERYLYIKYLNSTDYVNVYDDTGTHLFTFSETEFDMGSALAVAFTNFNDERMETVLNKEWDMVVGREADAPTIVGSKFSLDLGSLAPVQVQVIDIEGDVVVVKYLSSSNDRIERFNIDDFFYLSGLKLKEE
jgi:hypothetical protein